MPAPSTATRPRRSLSAAMLAVRTAITVSAMAAARPPGVFLTRFTAVVRRRTRALRRHQDSGLTTVEVAIITAVLLGLATALVVAITLVVNRNTARIK